VFDHVTIRVTDRAAAARFYEAALGPLGVETTFSTHAFDFWGEFSVTEAKGEQAVTRRLRVAFAAPSQDQVDAFWEAGLEAGGTGEAPPAVHGEVCSAALRDLGGNAVEAVHRPRLRLHHGAVDHLEVAVADVAAAASFYKTIAQPASLRLREETPERATFAVEGADGPTFTLVRGEPTAGLHIAFAGSDADARRFHEIALAAGYRDNGRPGERPQYHHGYYAAYVLDPDANNIEVVDHHRPPTNPWA
jgi:catechol 2,3-dioxygenase-like lactoylglutathione lyase family enzyme